MKIVSCLSFLILYNFSFSQSVAGIVKDANTQQVIPFASIGIAGTNYGTLGDQNGKFELTLRSNADTVRISSIGYSNLVVAGDKLKDKQFYLNPEAYNLSEVKISSTDRIYKTLGTINYSKKVCTAFIGENNNWRGEQAAIQANHIDGKTVFLESFGFYIIKNEYEDSLQFRIMLYEVSGTYGYPGKTFLKKPILFKTNVKQGEVRINLEEYHISTEKDFFISLECLEEKIESTKFCFAGSIKVPSFVKTTPFGKWTRVKGGGGDFNVKVNCAK
jgi:hypothetical protein